MLSALLLPKHRRLPIHPRLPIQTPASSFRRAWALPGAVAFAHAGALGFVWWMPLETMALAGIALLVGVSAVFSVRELRAAGLWVGDSDFLHGSVGNGASNPAPSTAANTTNPSLATQAFVSPWFVSSAQGTVCADSLPPDAFRRLRAQLLRAKAATATKASAEESLNG
jgi:hypothetical protein